MPRIMVVDDEAVLVELVASFIEDMGLQPIIATNGEEALASLRAAPEAPALILSDVMMPRMNGIELARVIKRDPQLRCVPVILMSAVAWTIDDQIADGFINKPFDLDGLTDLIRHYVESPRDGGPPRDVTAARSSAPPW